MSSAAKQYYDGKGAGSDALMFVDTHCHIDLYPDPSSVLAKAEANRIGVIAVTNAPSVFEHTAELVSSVSGAEAALGLHPELVEERAAELDLMWRLFERTRFVGEVGLDYTVPSQSNRKKQRDVFTKILERCERTAGKVLTVHSRRAAGDIVDAVGKSSQCRVILHWFSGSMGHLRRAVENGMYFSINPRMADSQSGQRVIRAVPRERILLETDGPYVSAGRRCSVPTDIPMIADAIGAILGEDRHSIETMARENLRRCLSSGSGQDRAPL